MIIPPVKNIDLSIWHGQEFWKKTTVFYAESSCRIPLLPPGPEWYSANEGKISLVPESQRTQYKGKQPFTFGFYEAFANIDYPYGEGRDKQGRFLLHLEGRNRPLKTPGTKIGTLCCKENDRYSHIPFEVYKLNEESDNSLNKEIAERLESYQTGIVEVPEETFLHFSAILDSRILYRRKIPYRPANELEEVQKIMNEQFRSVIIADHSWLHGYSNLRSCGRKDEFLAAYCSRRAI